MSNRKRGASKRARARAYYEHVTAFHNGGDRVLREPVRRVVHRGLTHVGGRFPSAKTGTFVCWESQIERDAFAVLEADAEVRAYHAQPEKISLKWGGARHRYTPDILVERMDGSLEVVEVKPDSRVGDEQVRQLVKAATRYYRRRGIRFRVWEETEIRAQPRLDNVNRMLRYNSPEPSPEQKLAIAAAFERAKPRTLAELREALKPGADESVLLSAALLGMFRMDVESMPLGPDTPVFPMTVPRGAVP